MVIPPPAPRAGSVWMTVQLSGGGTQVSVIPASDSGALVPLVVGATVADSAERTVMLSVVVQNRDRLRIHDVAVGTDTAPGYLMPGATTRPIAVRVALPAGDAPFRLTATGTVIYTIGLRAPSGTPDSIFVEARRTLFAHNEYAGHVTRNMLWLVFRPDATIDDRQAALEAVDGEVVGGTSLGAPNNYLVRFPMLPSGASPLNHDLAVLRRMPGVRFALIFDHDPLRAGLIADSSPTPSTTGHAASSHLP